MEDKYRLNMQRSEIWRSLRDGDFEEEEVWNVVRERPDYISELHKTNDNESSSPLSVPRFLPSTARLIPRTNSGSSSASSSQETKSLQQSAPVKIPDWSEIYRKKKNKTSKNVPRYSNDYDFYDNEGDGVANHREAGEEEEEDDYEYDTTRLPPHEIIARRLARSQISSFSVFEGVGRTLKGRDLSKVRNAVLIKTGFLESL